MSPSGSSEVLSLNVGRDNLVQSLTWDPGSKQSQFLNLRHFQAHGLPSQNSLASHRDGGMAGWGIPGASLLCLKFFQ